MKEARYVLLLCLVFCALAGCVASPVVMDNGTTQSKVFVPCASDALCVRNTYEVTKDVWCPIECTVNNVNCRRDYPVSYRSKNWEYETNRVEYIYTPKNIVVVK